VVSSCCQVFVEVIVLLVIGNGGELLGWWRDEDIQPSDDT
jgi:hypothetical protein